MSTRLRAVIAAAFATLIAVAVFGGAVDVLVARHLRRGLDSTLHARAHEVAQLAVSTPALLTAPGALDSPIGATQALVEVVDSRGRIVARSLALGGRVLPPALATPAIGGHSTFSYAHSGSLRLRVFAAPIAAVAGRAAGGAVVVAASTDDVDDTIGAVRVLTSLAAVGAAVIGATAIWLLLGRTLRPLERLDRAAAEIGRTGDPTRRLPDPDRRDEVGRLAGTLNAMLDTLERARENERRFVADASHELRTPLTALRGNVEHLVRHGASPDVLADLQADTERLARLAEDLLTLSRETAAAAPVAEVDLAGLARSADADDVDAKPALIQGDRNALARALANLVENARTHGAGIVRIETETVGSTACIRVSDEGAGVSEGASEAVFERFHGRGSGLGLAIVRATAERHRGRAYVRGATFTIELPAIRKASEARNDPGDEQPEKGSS